MKKVSVILPTYNRAKTIGNAIESVLTQTVPIYELIIADDGSTDGTEELVKSYPDSRIRYVRAEENQGAAAARNLGLKNVSADADFIAFEDSDDCWRPEKIEHQLEAFERFPESGFCYHKIAYTMSDGRVEIVPDESITPEKKSGEIYAQLLYNNLVGCPTLLAKKSVMDAVGFFDESLKAWEDYDLALRLAKKYKALFLDEVLLDAGYSTTGVSGSAGNYMMACCLMVRKYRDDLLATGYFNHRVETILTDAERLGMKEQITALLEKLLQT